MARRLGRLVVKDRSEVRFWDGESAEPMEGVLFRSPFQFLLAAAPARIYLGQRMVVECLGRHETAQYSKQTAGQTPR
jgi:hypothetical protein